MQSQPDAAEYLRFYRVGWQGRTLPGSIRLYSELQHEIPQRWKSKWHFYRTRGASSGAHTHLYSEIHEEFLIYRQSADMGWRSHKTLLLSLLQHASLPGAHETIDLVLTQIIYADAAIYTICECYIKTL